MWAVINEVRRHMTQLIRVTSTAEQRRNMTNVVKSPPQPGGGGRPCEAAISSSLYLSAVHKSCVRLLLLSSAAADLRSEDAPCDSRAVPARSEDVLCDSRLFLPGLRTRYATPGCSCQHLMAHTAAGMRILFTHAVFLQCWQQCEK